MGILVKHNQPTVSKYTLEGDSTLYLGIDRHPFTMGKVIFFHGVKNWNTTKHLLNIGQFKMQEMKRPVQRQWQQVEGYNIVIIESGTTGTPTLEPPESWKIQRDINTMCEWYREQIKGNKSINRKFKIK